MKDRRMLPVNLARTNFVRLGVVLVTLLGWFVLSNHCVLATLVQQKTNAHGSCHGEQPNAPSKHSGEDTPCCKTLRATVADAAKVMPAQVSVAPPQVAILPAIMVCPPPASVGIFTDSGPPRLSFAELVLQESVLAHAPPRFA